MDQRMLALQQAIHSNAAEVERWQTYHDENQSTITNLEMMVKRLKIEIMVPLGRKAFIPGELVHTNNILVSHYQNLFSTCSAQTAKDICHLRVQKANEQLQKYKCEADLWRNKLEQPFREGAFGSGMEQEIIEKYDEEQEKLWRKQHRQNVRKSKLNELEERKRTNVEGTDKEIFQLLEEAELMEELQNELENIAENTIDKEFLTQIMQEDCGPMRQKKRIAHNKINSENPVNNLDVIETDKISKNNNVNLNSKPEESTSCIDEDVQSEILFIKNQAEYLDLEDRNGFYEYQMEIIQQKLKALTLNSPADVKEKVRLLSILEQLEEFHEMCDDTPIFDCNPITKYLNTDPDTKTNDEELQVKDSSPKKATEKRKISFAQQDDTVEFFRHETVTQMMRYKQNPNAVTSKSKIQNIKKKNAQNLANIVEPNSKSKLSIEARVQKNIDYVQENQSEKDFHLVTEILKPTNDINTLYINFKHSKQQFKPSTINYNKISKPEEILVPNTPGDVYMIYMKYLQSKRDFNEKNLSTVYMNGYIGEENVRVPILKEIDRDKAFVDPKIEFSRPKLECKSILRNTFSAPNNVIQSKSISNTSNIKDNVIGQSVFNQIIKNVVEKPLEAVDPLPESDFIDTHQPKRRISRFKKIRQEQQKSVQ